MGVWDWGLGAVGDRESFGGLVTGFRGSFRYITVLWAWKYPLKTAILGAEYRCKELLFIGEVRWTSCPVRIFFFPLLTTLELGPRFLLHFPPQQLWKKETLNQERAKPGESLQCWSLLVIENACQR